MAARNWDDGQVALIEGLEAALFAEGVASVTVTGDEPVQVVGVDGQLVEQTETLVIPDAMLLDLVNDLLLPYAERRPVPKASKAGNPAKRAAENKARGVDAGQVTKVKGTTVEHEAVLDLPHSKDEGNRRRVRVSSVWPPAVPTASLTFTLLG